MGLELAYSFHLESDKNKSKLAKKVAKDNVSGTTSLSNNAIQNAKDLSDVNKHNLRDYDNQRELIKTKQTKRTIGSFSLVCFIEYVSLTA